MGRYKMSRYALKIVILNPQRTMLTFSEKLLSSYGTYLPLPISGVNPKHARAYHRKPAISSLSPNCHSRQKGWGIVLNARGPAARHVRGRHLLDDLAESQVLLQDPEAGNRKGPILRSGHIRWGRGWGSDHRGIEKKKKKVKRAGLVLHSSPSSDS